jgi:hypothetical protein
MTSQKKPLFDHPDAAAVVDHIAKASQRRVKTRPQMHIHRHPNISKIQMEEVEREYPDVWKGVHEFPESMLVATIHGIYLRNKIYSGLWQSGSDYLRRYIEDSKIALSEKGMPIFEAICYYKQFVTWDRLFLYLRDHNWGALKAQNLDAVPKMSRQEEEKTHELSDLETRLETLHKIFVHPNPKAYGTWQEALHNEGLSSDACVLFSKKRGWLK